MIQNLFWSVLCISEVGNMKYICCRLDGNMYMTKEVVERAGDVLEDMHS
jgi:hypothetical protein